MKKWKLEVILVDEGVLKDEEGPCLFTTEVLVEEVRRAIGEELYLKLDDLKLTEVE